MASANPQKHASAHMVGFRIKTYIASPDFSTQLLSLLLLLLLLFLLNSLSHFLEIIIEPSQHYFTLESRSRFTSDFKSAKTITNQTDTDSSENRLLLHLGEKKIDKTKKQGKIEIQSKKMFQYTEQDLLIPFHHPLSFYPPSFPTPETRGISATLIEPAPKSDNEEGMMSQRRQNRVVVLVHGQDTSKTYGYIPMLARSLASTHGLFALAFDFRSHGASQDADNAEEKGHLRQSEWADLSTVVAYAKRTLGLDVAAIVGHSRGSVAMMEWALLQQLNPDQGEDGGVYVPTLVNCSGRYSSGDLLQFQYLVNPDWMRSPPHLTARQRHGKWVEIKTPQSQIISMASSDTDLAKFLRPDTAVLTIHGDEDVMVSVDDAYKWDKQLGQVPGRHTIKILEGADHNYKLDDEDSKYFIKEGDKNARPTALRYIANLVTDFLSVENENKRFHAHTKFMPFTNNSVPRFKPIKNVVNFRDFGGFLSTVRNTTTAAGTVQWVKPGILFRSGKLDHAPPQTLDQIASEFNIKHVFDFRTGVELKPTKYTTPQGLVSIPGATTHHVPIFENESYAPQDLVARMDAAGGGDTSVLHDTNLEILYHGIRSRVFLNLFHFLRDNPHTPILVHCSAGKDRTGVFCALVLLLLGVDTNTVAHEYELTTSGYAPERNKIIGAMKRGHTAKTAYQGMSVQGWEALLSSRFETMLELISALDAEYGGVMGYLYNGVGLTPDDVARIRENLLYDGEPVEVHRVWHPKL